MTTTITTGDTCTHGVAVAAPIDGGPHVRGALVLYAVREGNGDSAMTNALAHAYATHIEIEVTSARGRQATEDGATEALLRALTAHDLDTARHSQIVRRLARTLADALPLGPRTLLDVERVALLHDIGKVAVPTELLRKDGPLTPAEWAVIRQHPSTGERIVQAVPALQAVSLGVRHHHERWDGAGYPDRLSGEDIPFAARLVALVDAYETMRTGRPYRRPLGYDEAIRELQEGAGSQFDPYFLPFLPILSE